MITISSGLLEREKDGTIGGGDDLGFVPQIAVLFLTFPGSGRYMAKIMAYSCGR